MKVAILESVDLLKAGKFDAIKKKVDSALKAGADKDVGHEYKDHIEERYEEGSRVCVSTSWDVINDITGGGLAGGELGVVVAPAGGGKSWGLINLAANALKSGKVVLYYTLELNAFYVGRRVDAFLTNIPFQNLGEETSKEKIKSTLENITGDLIIKHYPTRTASVITLSSHIEKCISQGKTPDIIIVDYADLIRPSKAGDKRLELNDIYEELRGLAGEYDIPIWTASQANRSSTEEDVIEGNKVSESYNKVMVADFIMSLSRKTNDKIGGTGRWHIIKNRFGPDGMTFPSKVNTMTGHIEIFEPNSDIARSINESMKGETHVKRALSEKFKQLEGF
jgi:replicative DNA helicase